MEEIKGDLFTVETIKEDLKALGITEGMTLIVHSSYKALGGFLVGGPESVILALEEVISGKGTLVMPTHTPDLSDPATWERPPVKEAWWETIRATMPPYDENLTPSTRMGIIPECFRKQRGVGRSNHPQVSFAAWGDHAADIIHGHTVEYCLGEHSPLARIYDLNGWVLLLGINHDHNTSIHLAEYRAHYKGKKEIINRAPMIVNNSKKWVEFKDIDFDSSDFSDIGKDFERDTNCTIRGKIANAEAILMPQKQLVDYAVQWLESNRVEGGLENE